jgi:hypothetical protein
MNVSGERYMNFAARTSRQIHSGCIVGNRYLIALLRSCS